MVHYLGSRYNYMDEILYSMIDFIGVTGEDLKEYDFYDICAGTGVLGTVYINYFKQVYANDVNLYPYILNSMRLEFGHATGCQHVYNYLMKQNQNTVVPFKDRIKVIADHLNSLPPYDGWFAQHYTDEWSQKAMFYSKENGRMIDAVRQEIAKWHSLQLTDKIENNYLLGSLLESADIVANVNRKYDTVRTPYHTEKFEFKPYIRAKEIPEETNCVTQMDCENTRLFISNPKSVIFFDPPFYRRDYAFLYGVPTTLALNDHPQIHGLANFRPTVPLSHFCKKSTFTTAVRSTIRNSFECNNAKYFFMLIPKHAYDQTFDIDELDKMFSMLQVSKLEKKMVYDYSKFPIEAPWRAERDDALTLFLYCIQR